MNSGFTIVDGNIVVPHEFIQRIEESTENNKRSLAKNQQNYYLNYLKERQEELQIERQIDQEHRDINQKLNFELMKTVGFTFAFFIAIVLIGRTIRI